MNLKFTISCGRNQITIKGGEKVEKKAVTKSEQRIKGRKEKA